MFNEKEFEKVVSNIIKLYFDYCNHKAEKIFIYFTNESARRVIIFFQIDGYIKHKINLNEKSSCKFDISEEKLADMHHISHKNFCDFLKPVYDGKNPSYPTEVKIIYFADEDRTSIEYKFEPVTTVEVAPDTYISGGIVAERWFLEMANKYTEGKQIGLRENLLKPFNINDSYRF